MRRGAAAHPGGYVEAVEEDVAGTGGGGIEADVGLGESGREE